MKCQNCGKNEVALRYSSNVNGCVTEASLCSACAAESGYDVGKLMGSMGGFNGFFPFFGGGAAEFPLMGFSPFGSPLLLGGFPVERRSAVPSVFRVLFGPASGGDGVCSDGGCGCTEGAAVGMGAPGVEVDVEMSRRRELNLLREEMRLAAGRDDFERAIELREKIRALDSGVGS